MLPLKHRLPLRTCRRDLESRAQVFHSLNFTFLVGAHHDAPKPTRLAVIVSKKISRKAVVRNHLKRQILGVVKELIPNIKPGFDCLILPKKTILQANYSQIKKEIDKMLTVGAIHESPCDSQIR